MVKLLALYWPLWVLLFVVLVVVAVAGTRLLYKNHQQNKQRAHELRLAELSWDAHMAPLGQGLGQDELVLKLNEAGQLLKSVVAAADREAMIEIQLGPDLDKTKRLLAELDTARHRKAVKAANEQVIYAPQRRGSTR